MPTTDRKLRVFLCHASQDKPVVRELYQRLLAEGWIDPWLDEKKILPGQDWNTENEKAVETADAVIVCLSNNSVSKEGYVQRELKFVLDIALEKPEDVIFVIPLRLDDCQPPRRLRNWQHVDYFPDYQRKLAHDRMMNSLLSRAENINKQSMSHGNRIIQPSRHALPKETKKLLARKNPPPDFKDSERSKFTSLSRLPEIQVSIKLGFWGFISASILEIFTSEIIYVDNYYLLINSFFWGVAASLFSLRIEKPNSRRQSIIVGLISGTICGAITSFGYFLLFKTLDAFRECLNSWAF